MESFELEVGQGVATTCPPGDLDAAIETALSTEPLRRVSPGFFGRIRQRLAMIALIQQERSRFRHSMTAGGATFVGILTAVILLAYIGSIPSRLAWYVPGGMGFLDYVKTQLFLSMRMFVAVIALGAAVPLGGVLFSLLRPHLRSSDSRKAENVARGRGSCRAEVLAQVFPARQEPRPPAM